MGKKKGEDLMVPLLVAGGVAAAFWFLMGMPTSVGEVNEKLQEVVSGKDQLPTSNANYINYRGYY
jgi:hypothetical protein